MSTIGKIEKGFVSDLTSIKAKMYNAAVKRETNRVAYEWNELFGEQKIDVTPLTEEEINLCEQFDNFVIFQR
jgi:hypothetical protein